MKFILAVPHRISDHLKNDKDMPSTNSPNGKIRLLVLGLLTGLLVSSADRSDAQPLIKIPIASPDLVVAVHAPPQIQQSDHTFLRITVNNAVTTLPRPGGSILMGAPANDVGVGVHFTGLEPLTGSGDSGFTCQPFGSGPVPTAMWCTGGAIGAGDTATIEILVKEIGNCQTYCGPVYTDAFVDPANHILEQSETNNRALGVTDVINCVN